MGNLLAQHVCFSDCWEVFGMPRLGADSEQAEVMGMKVLKGWRGRIRVYPNVCSLCRLCSKRRWLSRSKYLWSMICWFAPF